MRYAPKRDANEREIIEGLRALGASVTQIDGKGVPDLVIGHAGVNYLAEVKDPAKPPSARKLTKDQVTWHAAWEGQAAVIETLDDARTLLGL